MLIKQFQQQLLYKIPIITSDILFLKSFKTQIIFINLISRPLKSYFFINHRVHKATQSFTEKKNSVPLCVLCSKKNNERYKVLHINKLLILKKIAMFIGLNY